MDGSYENGFVKEYVEQYLNRFSSAKNKQWNYEDGCVVQGAIQLYAATGEESYKDFVLRYFDTYITESGDIRFYEPDVYNIDNIATGRSLFFAYAQTGEEKYRKAIDILRNQLCHHPRTKSGNFWHKQIYPWQIWLDGLYMAQPFYMMSETHFGGKEHYGDILAQFENVRKFLYNEEKGLYYHAYDESREQPWCNKETGLSPNFWLRSIGWLLMAIIDTYEEADEQIYEVRATLRALFKEGIKGLLQYQDPKSKLFYQVVDRSDVQDNYLETSGTAMVAYAILKACRLKVLQSEKYASIGEEILQNLIQQKLVRSPDGKIELTDMCSVAGLGPGEKRDGSVEYYLSEPIVSDDHKGTGAFIMAYAQLILLKKEEI